MQYILSSEVRWAVLRALEYLWVPYRQRFLLAWCRIYRFLRVLLSSRLKCIQDDYVDACILEIDYSNTGHLNSTRSALLSASRTAVTRIGWICSLQFGVSLVWSCLQSSISVGRWRRRIFRWTRWRYTQDSYCHCRRVLFELGVHCKEGLCCIEFDWNLLQLSSIVCYCVADLWFGFAY